LRRYSCVEGLPPIPKHLKYFTLEADSPSHLPLYCDGLFKSDIESIIGLTSDGRSTDMRKTLKSIEESPDKDDFLVGLEAR